MGFSLRQITPDDYDTWAALWRAYLAFYNTELPQAQYDHAFADLLSEAKTSFRGLLAVEEDTALGLVHYTFHAHLWRKEGVCYLLDLFTIPEARGKGVGRALIEAVYAAADREGVPEVYWMTQEHNHTARRLYDQIGQHTPFIKYRRP